MYPARTDPKLIPHARNILLAILRGSQPDDGDLKRLYGTSQAGELRSFIPVLMRQHGLHGGELRAHEHEDVRDIAIARGEIEISPHYQKLHATILAGHVPGVADLEPFYGEYAGAIRTVYAVYEERDLKRKCLLPSASHLNRVGAVVYQLQMEDPGSHTYAGFAALHDATEDLLTTATAFTAESIAHAYRNFIPSEHVIDEVILGGGGSYNATLRRMLQERLPETQVFLHEDFGIRGDAKEALAFAILGNETMLGRPASLPKVTGARRAVILGKIVPAG